VGNELDHLAFGNAADLIQVQATLALDVFGIFRRTKKGVGNHSDGGYGGATHR
jgi:hypothetical protein